MLKNRITRRLLSKTAVLWGLGLASQTSVKVAALGDWGAASPFRPKVAAGLRALHDRVGLDALLTLGDNFYPVGEPVQAWIDDLPKVELLPTYGNHDVPNLGRQLQAFGTPSPFYTHRMGALELFVVYSEAFTLGQKDWLDTVLKASKAPWKVVVLHRPIRSSGLHGGHSGLRSALEPLLKKHGIRLVLTGHEHIYERIEFAGITHVSSTGGAWPRGFRIPVQGSLKRYREPTYLLLEATPDRLSLTAYGLTETVDQVVFRS
jgi:tartrate-resistant acid phosphatase type 5